jgi:chromosomal replication initiation ATPase DnaA
LYDCTGRRDKTYCFDSVFSETTSNREVYNYALQPILGNILDGYNVTCFAYGMTGAGKTHTMVGTINENLNEFDMGLCM